MAGSHSGRLDALERAMRVTMEGHVVVLKGGLPNADPTAAQIAEAYAQSKAERGRTIVLGGLPDDAGWLQ